MCRSICSKKEQEASAAKRKGAQEEAGARLSQTVLSVVNME